MRFALIRWIFCWQARAVALLVMAAVSLLPCAVHAQVIAESQLKSAYLLNFMKYVQWPQSRSSAELCLFGRDTLGAAIATYEGRVIEGRELHIRRVSTPEQIAGCHLLFVPEIEEARIGAVLRWLDRQPVLTVSDTENFAQRGGGIAMVYAEGRIQFEVNFDTLTNDGLKADPHFLRLARRVYGSAK